MSYIETVGDDAHIVPRTHLHIIQGRADRPSLDSLKSNNSLGVISKTSQSLKNHIEGNAHIAQFDGTNVTAVNVYQLRKL